MGTRRKSDILRAWEALCCDGDRHGAADIFRQVSEQSSRLPSDVLRSAQRLYLCIAGLDPETSLDPQNATAGIACAVAGEVELPLVAFFGSCHCVDEVSQAASRLAKLLDSFCSGDQRLLLQDRLCKLERAAMEVITASRITSSRENKTPATEAAHGGSPLPDAIANDFESLSNDVLTEAQAASADPPTPQAGNPLGAAESVRSTTAWNTSPLVEDAKRWLETSVSRGLEPLDSPAADQSEQSVAGDAALPSNTWTVAASAVEAGAQLLPSREVVTASVSVCVNTVKWAGNFAVSCGASIAKLIGTGAANAAATVGINVQSKLSDMQSDGTDVGSPAVLQVDGEECSATGPTVARFDPRTASSALFASIGSVNSLTRFSAGESEVDVVLECDYGCGDSGGDMREETAAAPAAAAASMADQVPARGCAELAKDFDPPVQSIFDDGCDIEVLLGFQRAKEVISDTCAGEQLLFAEQSTDVLMAHGACTCQLPCELNEVSVSDDVQLLCDCAGPGFLLRCEAVRDVIRKAAQERGCDEALLLAILSKECRGNEEYSRVKRETGNPPVLELTAQFNRSSSGFGCCGLGQELTPEAGDVERYFLRVAELLANAHDRAIKLAAPAASPAAAAAAATPASPAHRRLSSVSMDLPMRRSLSRPDTTAPPPQPAKASVFRRMFRKGGGASNPKMQQACSEQEFAPHRTLSTMSRSTVDSDVQRWRVDSASSVRSSVNGAAVVAASAETAAAAPLDFSHWQTVAMAYKCGVLSFAWQMNSGGCDRAAAQDGLRIFNIAELHPKHLYEYGKDVAARRRNLEPLLRRQKPVTS